MKALLPCGEGLFLLWENGCRGEFGNWGGVAFNFEGMVFKFECLAFNFEEVAFKFYGSAFNFEEVAFKFYGLAFNFGG